MGPGAISAYSLNGPPGAGGFEARYSLLQLASFVFSPPAIPHEQDCALIVAPGYIGANDPKRQGQRHFPNASDSGLA